MSEGRPILNSSNPHKVAHEHFILEAFVTVVFAPGAAQAISKRSHSLCFFVWECVLLHSGGCEMFRIAGERHSESHEKSKHFRIRVGEIWVTVQELRSKSLTAPHNFILRYQSEGFLECNVAKKLYSKLRIKMWHVPPRSPDHNPVEKFWAWMRKKLRAPDLKDAVSNRPVLGKTAYRERVRRALKSQEARTVAKICALGLRKVCKRVVESGGIATRG
jgi:hypothetical protein